MAVFAQWPFTNVTPEPPSPAVNLHSALNNAISMCLIKLAAEIRFLVFLKAFVNIFVQGPINNITPLLNRK